MNIQPTNAHTSIVSIFSISSVMQMSFSLIKRHLSPLFQLLPLCSSFTLLLCCVIRPGALLFFKLIFHLAMISHIYSIVFISNAKQSLLFIFARKYTVEITVAHTFIALHFARFALMCIVSTFLAHVFLLSLSLSLSNGINNSDLFSFNFLECEISVHLPLFVYGERKKAKSTASEYLDRHCWHM